MKVPETVAKLFGPKSHPNSIYSSKQRLRSLCIPNYVNTHTKPTVLSLYRTLHRNALRQMDPACRRFLVQEIWENFASARYETSTKKIEYLISEGHAQNQLLKRVAEVKSAVKERDKVFEYCFERINIVEGDLKKIFGSATRLPQTPARDIVYMRRPSRIDTLDDYKSNLARAKQNFRTGQEANSLPSYNTSESLNPKDQKKNISNKNHNPNSLKELDSKDRILPHIYFRFATALQHVSFVAHPIFTSFKIMPQIEGTATGKPFPKCREKNLVHNTIRNVLRLKINPFDDKVAKYIESMINTDFSRNVHEKSHSNDQDIEWIKIFGSQSVRHYKRRLYDITQRRYTVSYDSMHNIIIKGLQVTKIKTIERG